MQTGGGVAISTCEPAQAESAGVSYITIHARTAAQRSTDAVDMAAVRIVRDSVRIPIVYNGDVNCMDDVQKAYEVTRCHGVM